MKNKLLKGGHLSEKKCREILQLFCDDLTATHIADISGVSRVTINSYFKLIRSAIAGYCEKINLSYRQFNSPFSNGSQEQGTELLPAYYGFYMNDEKISTAWLIDVCETSINRLKESTLNSHCDLSATVFAGYHAVADCSEWNLYWVNEHKPGAAFFGIPEIALFWKYTKSRLHKFRGMHKKTLYLHIKECEFRYNFRNNDILSVLSGILNDGKQAENSFYEPAGLYHA